MKMTCQHEIPVALISGQGKIRCLTTIPLANGWHENAENFLNFRFVID
jgi:hypothetical protein